MLKTITLVLAVLALAVLALLAFATTRPDNFRVERTITVKAPPGRLFDMLNDFHRWRTWSPWEKLDPAMKRTYRGPVSGKGAVYEWEGNSAVGSGRMEIAESNPPTKLIIKLDFLEPFQSHNISEFTIEPRGGITQVTWEMRGPAPFLAKLMQVFVSMDKMIGKDFETGLANLKAEAENPQSITFEMASASWGLSSYE